MFEAIVDQFFSILWIVLIVVGSGFLVSVALGIFEERKSIKKRTGKSQRTTD